MEKTNVKSIIGVEELSNEFLRHVCDMMEDECVPKFKINHDRIYPSDNILYNDKYIIIKVNYLKPIVDDWVNRLFTIEGKELYYKDWLNVIVENINDKIIFRKKKLNYISGNTNNYCYNLMKVDTCNSDRYIKLFINPMEEAVNRNLQIAKYDDIKITDCSGISDFKIKDYDNCNITIEDSKIKQCKKKSSTNNHFNFISGIRIDFCKPFSTNTYIAAFDIYIEIGRDKNLGFNIDGSDSIHIHAAFIFDPKNIDKGTLSIYNEVDDNDELNNEEICDDKCKSDIKNKIIEFLKSLNLKILK